MSKRVAWRWLVSVCVAAGLCGAVGAVRGEDKAGTEKAGPGGAAPASGRGAVVDPPALPGARTVPSGRPGEDGQTLPNARVRPAFTLPFKKYDLAFSLPGTVKTVHVKEGAVVKKGEVLMELDDAEEQAELAIAEFGARNETLIKITEAKARAKEYEFQFKDNLKKQGHGVELEWQIALAERDMAKEEIEKEKTELKQRGLARDKQQTRLSRMKLVAPVDGVILETRSEVGSHGEPSWPAILMVANDPLKVEVFIPSLDTLSMKIGDKLRVSYDTKEWKEASVSYMSPEADASSGMRKVHLEMPNPELKPSGLQAFVELPGKMVAANDGR